MTLALRGLLFPVRLREEQERNREASRALTALAKEVSRTLHERAIPAQVQLSDTVLALRPKK